MTRSQLSKFPIGSADYVIAHAKRQRSRGKQPSTAYLGKLNPREALKTAKLLHRDQSPVVRLGLEETAIKTAMDLVAGNPSNENVKLAIRAIVACSSTEDEIYRLVEELGCTNPTISMDIPNDRIGFEARDLGRALGGLVAKNGAMVMIMADSPLGSFISM